MQKEIVIEAKYAPGYKTLDTTGKIVHTLHLKENIIESYIINSPKPDKKAKPDKIAQKLEVGIVLEKDTSGEDIEMLKNLLQSHIVKDARTCSLKIKDYDPRAHLKTR